MVKYAEMMLSVFFTFQWEDGVVYHSISGKAVRSRCISLVLFNARTIVDKAIRFVLNMKTGIMSDDTAVSRKGSDGRDDQG